MTLTLIIIIVSVALFYYCVRLAAETFYDGHPAQTVCCPETGKYVRVQLDATLAALTAVPGPPKLRVEQCELWPERQGCGQRCVRPQG